MPLEFLGWGGRPVSSLLETVPLGVKDFQLLGLGIQGGQKVAVTSSLKNSPTLGSGASRGVGERRSSRRPGAPTGARDAQQPPSLRGRG